MDYLLGKDRQRVGATVLQGKSEEVRELIDASPYVKKYTSGVLSFAEENLPPGQSEKLMESFERVLMPGLEKDQYSILWVEHADKGRLELNFLIPNTELLTGKRLQPYYDRADRPRIDAWQTVVNGRLGLHDPNAPEHRRAMTTPSALPETKLEAAEAITRGLLALASSGELKTRHDVTEALETSGFKVVRTTKSSISIADPEGGRNIRLKGALYEQSFNAGEGLRAEIERAAAEYRADAESRIQRARSVCKSGTERKREENQRRYQRPRPAAGLSPRAEYKRDVADGQQDVADHRPGVCPADRLERGHTVVAGAADPRQLHNHPRSETNANPAVAEEQRRAVIDLRGQSASLRESGAERGNVRERKLDDTGGEIVDDRTGKTVIERVRAATAGLLDKAGRVGGHLRRFAEDVFHYATGERETERAGQQLEQAGAEFKRAAAPVVESLNTIELRQQHERELQYQKTLEPERSPRQKTYHGPTLG